MKKIAFVLMGFSVAAIFATSCGKQCYCTRYEDGKKIVVYTDNDTKFFDATICKNNSVTPYQGFSMVSEGKEVTVEIRCK